MIHFTHLGFLGLITSSFMLINAMESDLNKTIEQYPLISFNADQLSTLKNIHDNHVPECILQCNTEEEIYTYISTQYKNAYEAVKNIISDNKFLIDISTNYLTITALEEIEEEYEKKTYNQNHYCEAIQKDKDTVVWNNVAWPHTKLIKKEDLPIVNEIAKSLGINPNCFIIVNTSSLKNAIMNIDYSRYFLLGLTEDTMDQLKNTPNTCCHILFHEFNHLKSGDGEKNKAIAQGTSYSFTNNNRSLKHTGFFPELNAKRANLSYWRELRADIESVLYPNKNNCFSQKAKEKIYLSALLLSLQCDYQKNLWRIGLFLRLLDCNGTPLDFTHTAYTLFGYRIFKNK